MSDAEDDITNAYDTAVEALGQQADEANKYVGAQLQAACKTSGLPDFVCEARLPHLNAIPWWVWTAGAIGVGAVSLYVYAAYKLAPTALKLGTAVYAPEFLPVVNQVLSKPTPAVQEALQVRR